MDLLVSDAVLLEVVKTIGIIATAILSTIGIVLSTRTRKEQKDLSVKVDGRLSELLEETKKSHELMGHKAGVAEQKIESASNAAVVAETAKAAIDAAKTAAETAASTLKDAATKLSTPAASPIELKIPNLVVEIKPPVAPPPEDNSKK